MADKPIALEPGQRVMAHRIIYNGKEYPLSVAAIDTRGEVSITPFEREIPGTLFVNGTIELQVSYSSFNPPALAYRPISRKIAADLP